ncbi:MAG: hypothetical protein B6245_23185, partial [Desulfobacteraceae bacterium 4572_88]
FVSFVGPSGSGKTTMLNLIGCLDKPTKGKVVIGKDQVDAFDRIQRAAFRESVLGFIFQAFNLFQVLTTYENVEYPLVMIKNRNSGDILLISDKNDRIFGIADVTHHDAPNYC